MKSLVNNGSITGHVMMISPIRRTVIGINESVDTARLRTICWRLMVSQGVTRSQHIMALGKFSDPEHYPSPTFAT